MARKGYLRLGNATSGMRFLSSVGHDMQVPHRVLRVETRRSAPSARPGAPRRDSPGATRRDSPGSTRRDSPGCAVRTAGFALRALHRRGAACELSLSPIRPPRTRSMVRPDRARRGRTLLRSHDERPSLCNCSLRRRPRPYKHLGRLDLRRQPSGVPCRSLRQRACLASHYASGRASPLTAPAGGPRIHSAASQISSIPWRGTAREVCVKRQQPPEQAPSATDASAAPAPWPLAWLISRSPRSSTPPSVLLWPSSSTTP